MSTDIELHQSSLSEQMEFARAVVTRPEGGARSLLPDSYRDNPGNVLIAVGLGQSMGLSPAESLYRIDVIQGKPTAGAELIAANVRKAGHKLRVKVTENPPSATCTIIRADDPDEPTTVTRDMEWAQKMGLSSKDNYKKQPATMLSWRAISACARLACPEALYGVAYTPDEMADMTPQRSAGGLGAALNERTAVPGEPLPEVDESAYPPDAQPVPPAESALLNTSSKLAKAMYAGINEAGIPESDRISFICEAIGREVTSSKEITEDEARRVLDYLPAQGELIDADDHARAVQEEA